MAALWQSTYFARLELTPRRCRCRTASPPLRRRRVVTNRSFGMPACPRPASSLLCPSLRADSETARLRSLSSSGSPAMALALAGRTDGRLRRATRRCRRHERLRTGHGIVAVDEAQIPVRPKSPVSCVRGHWQRRPTSCPSRTPVGATRAELSDLHSLCLNRNRADIRAIGGSPRGYQPGFA